MQKNENKTEIETPVVVVVDNKAALSTLQRDVLELTSESIKLNAKGNQFTRNALKVIKDMIVIRPTLIEAADLSEFNSIMAELTYLKESITEQAIVTIHDVKQILQITERDEKASYLKILQTISSKDRVTLTMYRDLVKSRGQIDKEMVFIDGFNFIAKIENILLTDVPKNDAILMPKKSVGQLYPTAKQVEEMKPTAKKTISFARELKKLGSQIGGAMKKFEKQEVNTTDFTEFLKDNIEDIVSEYLVKRDEDDKGSSVSATILKSTVADQAKEIAELKKQIEANSKPAKKSA